MRKYLFLLFFFFPVSVFAYSDFQLPISPTCITSIPLSGGAVTCDKLLDNDSSTYGYVYTMGTSGTQNIDVDYGANYAVSRVIYSFHGGDVPTALNVYVSPDGVLWSLVASTSSGLTNGINQLVFAPVSAHFVRFSFDYSAPIFNTYIDGVFAYGTEIIDDTTLTAFAGSSKSSLSTLDFEFLVGLMFFIGSIPLWRLIFSPLAKSSLSE